MGTGKYVAFFLFAKRFDLLNKHPDILAKKIVYKMSHEATASDEIWWTKKSYDECYYTSFSFKHLQNSIIIGSGMERNVIVLL